MILRQYLDIEPVVAASYLVGCGGKRVAAVIDPLGEPDRYLDDAAALGVELRYVIDTHVHADHVSAGRELARRANAQYALFADSEPAYDFTAIADGDVLDLGNVALRVLHTPGHTPEHVTLLATDGTRAPEPWLAFTGHTLMVGDMGRTELATNAEEGACTLFESARKLRRLPDYLTVLPGAFSGSVCGRGLSGTPVSTIGFERHHNRSFRLTDREEFMRLMTSDIPPRPPRAEEIRAFNLGRTAAVGV